MNDIAKKKMNLKVLKENNAGVCRTHVKWTWQLASWLETEKLKVAGPNIGPSGGLLWLMKF